MVKNENVINAFIWGLDNAKTKNLFIEKNNNRVMVLYSYGYHYPLCIKLLDNTFLINNSGYSMTTARHKSLLCYALNNCNFKQLQQQNSNNSNIMLFNTEQLKNILNLGFKNKCEIIEDKI